MGEAKEELKIEGTRKVVYDYIVEYIEKNMYAPSVREICEGVNLKSTSSVHRYLKDLEMMGVIKTLEGQPRAINLSGYKIVKE